LIQICKQMKTRIITFLAEGFEEIEAITPIDILRRAECEVITVSTTNSITVTGAHGISIVADTLFSEMESFDADVIFLPGGMPGSLNLNAHEGVKHVVKQQAQKGKFIAAICAAPLILGGLGILQNKQATCYPGYENTLTGAEISKQSCVVDANIITGNGPGAAAKLGFTLVSLLKGEAIANQWESGMMFS